MPDHDKKALRPDANTGCLGTKGLSLPWYHPSSSRASRPRPSKVRANARAAAFFILSAITSASPIPPTAPTAVQANSSEETSHSGIKVPVSAIPILSAHKSPNAFSSSQPLLLIDIANIIFPGSAFVNKRNRIIAPALCSRSSWLPSPRTASPSCRGRSSGSSLRPRSPRTAGTPLPAHCRSRCRSPNRC